MSLSDLLEKKPTNIDHKEFAMISISRINGIASLLDYEGFSIELNVKEGGIDAEDMGLGPAEGCKPGLWIGEGIPDWVPTGSVDGYPDESEWETEYNNFTWKRPTPEEIEALNNETLWGKRVRCQGCGQFLNKGKELILRSNKNIETFCTNCYQEKTMNNKKT